MLSGGDLYRAPFTRNSSLLPQVPSRILDIGTGTAEWATEMAEDFPTTTILGTDLSPIQPSWAPPNCRFFIDDAESDWAFSPSEAFDYIHARSLGGGIADWPRLLRQAYTHLKPGGWFEAQEFETLVLSDDGTHTRATNVLAWQDQLNQASKKFGKPVNVAPRLSGWMEDAGFVNVADDVYKVSSFLGIALRWDERSLGFRVFLICFFFGSVAWERSTMRAHDLCCGRFLPSKAHWG